MHHTEQERRAYQSVHCLPLLPPSACVLFRTTVCYNLNTAIISFCTVITTVATLTPVSSRAWQHALINTVQHSISLYQPEYGCGQGGHVGMWKDDQTVNGVRREWGVWLYSY